MGYFETIFTGVPPSGYLVLFLISIGVNLIIVTTCKVINYRGRCQDDLSAVQAMHEVLTPRIGGLAILAGILALYPLFQMNDLSTTYVTRFIACLTPILITGFAEDFGFHIQPKWRLATAIVSSTLAIHFSGLTIERSSMSPLDAVLAFTPAAVVFTLFAAAGIVNAFNLIDGLNGLAGLTGLGVAVSLSIVAHRTGQTTIASITLLLVPILLGFLALNYPFGKIFLGDAGAYILGFTLAWVAIAIYSSEEVVSPFALILIFFWPVADTLLAIWRRTVKGSSSARPDRLHFHHLAMRWLLIKTRMSKQVANPVATLVNLPMLIVPQVVGVLTWKNFEVSFAALIVCSVTFVVSYQVGLASAKKRRKYTSLSTTRLEVAE